MRGFNARSKIRCSQKELKKEMMELRQPHFPGQMAYSTLAWGTLIMLVNPSNVSVTLLFDNWFVLELIIHMTSLSC